MPPRRRTEPGPCAVARGAAASVLLALATACAPSPSERPERIFLFVVDTLRRDHVGVYDPDARTPHIDRLARGGQVFERAVSSFHQTSMSMAALLTGRTPSIERGDGDALPWTGETWCGLSRFAQPDAPTCVPDALETLAERLRAGGYRTAGVVTNHFLFDPAGFSQGFDDWIERPLGRGSDARSVERDVLGLLERHADEPLFLYVHWIDVHQYGARPGYRPQHYRPAVERFDAAFGRLLDAIEHLGAFEDALVVFTSDHGERLLEHAPIRAGRFHNGNPSLDPVLEVPLIARPGLAADPAAPIRSEDVPRLVLNAAGIDAGTDASDLEPGELYLSELAYQTYRRGRFKATRHRRSGRIHLLELDGPSPESEDVAAAHPEMVRALSRRIDALEARLGDDRLAGSAMTDADRDALRALGYLE